MSSALETAQQLASRLQGVREYYFSRKLQEIAQRRAAGEDIINLGIGNPDLPPPPAVAGALLGDLRQSAANGYQSYRGIPRWRKAIRTWYQDVYQVELEDAELLPLNGSKEGIVHLALAYLEAGKAMLYPAPGYPAYAAAARLTEAEGIGYPLPDSESTVEDWIEQLDALCTNKEVRLLFVNSPHMPTGQVLAEEFAQALIAFAKTKDILLISDNAYSYYTAAKPKSFLSYPGAREVAVELNSLSKSHHMAGWRLAALLGRADVVASTLQVKSNFDSGQFRPLQAGGAVALRTEWAWHEEQRSTNRRRRALTTDLFEKLGCEVAAHQYGLFVWAKLPADAPTSEEWSDRLLDVTGVFIPPGTVFGEAGEGFVRASLCSPEDLLQQAVDRILSQKASL